MRRLVRLAMLAGCAGMAGCRSAPKGPEEVVRAERDAGWSGAFERAEGWTGGDGCSTVALSGGRVLWLFSDSTIGPVREGRHAPGTVVVNNAVAVGGAGRGPLEFAWGAGEKPRAMFTPAGEGVWYWMAGGGLEVSPGGPLVLFVWRMGRAGRPGVWDFELRGTDVVVVENPGEAPASWRWRAAPLFGADGGAAGRRRAWGSAVLRDGAWVYVYGVDTTDVRNKGLLVARCGAVRLAEGAWEFRTRAGAWSPRAEEAGVIAAGAVDEFSVQRAEGGYVLVQMEENLGRRVLVRTAAAPEGPWSPGRAVWACPEPLGDARVMVYTARGHLEVSDGAGLVVTYCVNSRDFGHMMGDAGVYRPRGVLVPWGAVRGDRIDP